MLVASYYDIPCMSMNIAVLGAQWGDEGKGKIVDMLTPHFSAVARYQGRRAELKGLSVAQCVTWDLTAEVSALLDSTPPLDPMTALEPVNKSSCSRILPAKAGSHTISKGAVAGIHGFSVCSPRVVDDESPRSVGLPAQNVRAVARQLHGATVRAGSRERPLSHDEGQIAGLKDPRHPDVERALHSDERGEPLANAR